MTTRREFTTEILHIVETARRTHILEPFVSQFQGMYVDTKRAGIEITPDKYLQLADDALWMVLDASDAA